MALKLAEAEQLDDDTREIVQLAALLHDIADWKYSGSETAGAEAAETFLVSHDYPRDKVEIIKTIILGISYHSELGGKIEMFPALAVVQDADRLDAIGAVGIARCFAYGGSRGRPLYDPSCPPSEVPLSLWNPSLP